VSCGEKLLDGEIIQRIRHQFTFLKLPIVPG
jgi:hypothetical protein